MVEKYTIERDEKHPEFITVKGEGVELTYYEVYEVGSNDLKRKWGEVHGVGLHTDRYNNYWCKAGRGKMKNQKLVEATLKEVDSWLYNEKGFFFER
ncbi:hypothetical protein CN613_25615 [Bacillus pseudomycoides]|uniref:Uncharacterized protein n=1 Tax=Bacillus pseudomycoides TaxID=64104 RepID=A0A2A8BZG0_9BACI|nr:hypothetical protein CN613_25615 [Bacillus pseudomycoides]